MNHHGKRSSSASPSEIYQTMSCCARCRRSMRKLGKILTKSDANSVHSKWLVHLRNKNEGGGWNSYYAYGREELDGLTKASFRARCTVVLRRKALLIKFTVLVSITVSPPSLPLPPWHLQSDYPSPCTSTGSRKDFLLRMSSSPCPQLPTPPSASGPAIAFLQVPSDRMPLRPSTPCR